MVDPEELKKLIEDCPKLVSCKRSKRYPDLRVVKYTRKVFYDNLWNENPLLLECRGLVINDDYETVIKPFTKIFNFNENKTLIHRDELCTAVRKINGFMGAVTYTKEHGVIVSTTGSLDSNFVDMAKEIIPENEFKRIDDIKQRRTWLYEIVHPNDPHIVKEKIGAYLIGAEDVLIDYSEDQESLDNYGSNVMRPTWIDDIRFSDILEKSKQIMHEGYVVYGKTSGTVLKLKSPYYLVSKLFGRMKSEKLLEKLSSKKLLKGVDEDFLPIIEHIKLNLEEFVNKNEREKIEFVQNYLDKEIYNA